MSSRLAESAKKANTCSRDSGKLMDVLRTWSSTLLIVARGVAPARYPPSVLRQALTFAASLCVLFREGAIDLRSVFLLVDHDCALERDDRLPVLVVAGRLHHHYPHVRSRARLALLEHLTPGVDRVPLEDRCRQPDLVPSEVGEDVLGDIGDALPRNQRQREGRVHERLD